MSITTPKPTVPEPAEREPAPLFRYSTWLHVGLGAEECSEIDEQQGTNTCGDRSHFHAWCRLPNPLQQAEIRDRALAAKARKIRQLHDPSTDGYEILEEEFGRLAREGDAARPKLVEELLAQDYWQDYYAAMMDVREIEGPQQEDGDGEPPKLYEHIGDDQARFLRLEGAPESERPADEYLELTKHLAAYQEAINEALKQRQDPKRQALEGLETGQLLDQLRDKRIEAEAMADFRRATEVHEMLSCAYREPEGPPALADLAVLERAAAEIVTGLQATFADLRRTAQEAQGN